MTKYLTLSTERPNQKQKARTAITGITPKEFRKLLNKFKNLPHLGYNKKQVHNEPTESYLLLVRHISNILKSKKHVQLRTQRVKSGAIGTKNFKIIQSGINSMNEEEPESANVTRAYKNEAKNMKILQVCMIMRARKIL